MNKRQKEVQQVFLNSEKAVLKQLEKNYREALNDINSKLAALQSREDADMQYVIYQVEYQKALKAQVEGILDQLHANEFETVSDYLTKSYENGFIGSMYDMQGQGVPLLFPIDQAQVVKAIQHDTKLSEDLYSALGKDIKKLSKQIASEISRGLSSGAMYSDIARNIREYAQIPQNNAMRIARTEAHRIQCQAAADAQFKAKEKGADVVKQWDAALDGSTRPTHRQLDGQIRELEEPFEVAGMKAMQPGGFGRPEEDINCRCALLQRARWALGNSFTKYSPDAPVFDDDDSQYFYLEAEDYDAFKAAYYEMIDNGQSIVKSAEKLRDEALAHEKEITKDLFDAVGEYGGSLDYKKPDGTTTLDTRIKGITSMTKKIKSDFETGMTLSSIETSIYDALRYSDITGEKLLVDEFNSVRSKLESKGYKFVRVKNAFADRNTNYNGINVVIQSPDGYRFEFQFHTPKSLEWKESTHGSYEKLKSKNISDEEKDTIVSDVVEKSLKVKKPRNIDTIISFSNL